jgi:TATA-binding protein-associated factor
MISLNCMRLMCSIACVNLMFLLFQVASMVIVSWFKDLRSRDPVLVEALLAFLSSVKEWLLDLLTCSDPSFPTKDSVFPYTELARTYAKMRNEANNLLQSIDSCTALKEYMNSSSFDVNVLSVDDAINFASKLLLPSESDLPSESEKFVLNNLESAKQGLLSTSGYLKCVQVHVISNLMGL